jgi:hypothetical protein
MGKTGPDTAPDDGTYQWKNPNTGETETIPNGIDPGFDYNPGHAAWGKKLDDATMDYWRSQKGAAWERLTPGDAATYGRPASIALDAPKAAPDFTIEKTPEGIWRAVVAAMSADEKVFSYQSGEFRYQVHANAETLARHVDPALVPYIPLLDESLSDPFEVWLSFERHKGTGQVVLRMRVIKGMAIKGKPGMLVVTNAVKGRLEAWTVIPTSDLKYAARHRVGKLVYSR